MFTRIAAVLLAASVLVICNHRVRAATVELNDRTFTLPDGFELERVAGPPLVNRPICADFDEQGRLYVADSSGSNERVQIQLEKKPHRIVRLEDSDGDGQFDRSVVFADRMMFPEGAMWYDGSLYVAAAPQIWKLTDTDDDGVADRREVWFDGKTLTGCANDLHGPFLGPDGWIYWCKGAFAEQTYEREGKPPLVTRAAHIFRRRPEGGEIEAVMTGGMDNPVELVFTPGGERIFTTTFLVHPGGGQRDGLIHAVYGGVYGKQHGVLDGHPRTGPLMPVLTHLGAAAPCGLVRLESNQLGAEFQNNLLATLFNMHKVTRHVLTPSGATFDCKNEDFLVCDNVDFHPTDVLEDADGSVLVIDTGGWYKLCCPTSQLYKPDIFGAIYRVRRSGSHHVLAPRGAKNDWSAFSDDQLAQLLGDDRPAVARRAMQLLAKHGETAIGAVSKRFLVDSNPNARRRAVWTLSQIGGDAALARVDRVANNDTDEIVQQAAIHVLSAWKEQRSSSAPTQLLRSPSLHVRRVAAEAVGSLGDSTDVISLLGAVGKDCDRVLEHSLVFALIEIADPVQTRLGLTMKDSRKQRAALVALDQMPGGDLAAEDVVPQLSATDAELRGAAWWIAERHPQWAAALRDFFHTQVWPSERQSDESDEQVLTNLSQRLPRFAHDPVIQTTVASGLNDDAVPKQKKLALLQAMAASGLKQLPSAWSKQLSRLFTVNDPEMLRQCVSTALAVAKSSPDANLADRLRDVAANETLPDGLRLEALAAVFAARGKQPPADGTDLEPDALHFVCKCLSVDRPVRERSLAVDVLLAAWLNDIELELVAESLVHTGPMELRRLLPKFETRGRNENLGLLLVETLGASDVALALNQDELTKAIAPFGDSVMNSAAPLLAKIAAQNKDKIERLQSVLALLDKADVRRGHQVFHSTKASCIACHQLGYLGGRVGPDLNRIGRIRTERDLLESILFPSASFVRSYEPVEVITTDGKIITGVIRDETAAEMVLALDAEKEVHIPHEAIEERSEGKVSIMPAGLDKQLTLQELADLVAFLKAEK